MKVKRLKTAEKYLMFFKLHYGLKTPYHLLLDGTICNAAFSNHINLSEQLPKYLQGEVIMQTTQCAVGEVEGLQAKFGEWHPHWHWQTLDWVWDTHSETVADWVTVSDPRLVNPVTGWVINCLLCTIVYMVVGFFGMFSHRCTQSLWQWVNDTITHAAFSIWFPDVAQISQTIDNAGHFITTQYALVNW